MDKGEQVDKVFGREECLVKQAFRVADILLVKV
jgi:hypothetical protein